MMLRRLMFGLTAAAALGAAAPESVGLWAVPAQAASEVAVVVNRQPITTFQIRQRTAFLKLRREGGNLKSKATEELIDEALKTQEMSRRGINVPDQAVEAAFAKFAADNKLSQAQLTQVLSQAGFSARAFKDYIRVQMGWGQAVQASMRSNDRLSEQDVVQRMLAQGGQKPTTTEYTLQQVIFVIPSGERGKLMSQRKREAQGMRSRFQSCPQTYETAKALRDVTVRELGRVAQPQLPPQWKQDIENTSVGRTTPVKETERGVEFIAVCDSRKVSDDVAAAMVFQSRDLEKLGKEGSGPDKKLLKELREKAQIIRK